MIQKTLLGNTGISVSQIGLGTVKFGRNQKINYPETFDLPSDNEIIELLYCAEELGINILDTAPAYGTSEERLGKLLKSQRQNWILCTKVGEEFINGESSFDFSTTNLRTSIERSLNRLKTDYLDIVLVHSNGEDKKIIDQDNVFSTLADLKKSGLIRAFGMSTKTLEGGLLAVDQSDVVMVTYNPTHTLEQPVIAHAKQKNKGIFIKKALVSGHLQKIADADADPIQTAMQFIFEEQGISSIIVGTLNPEHLRYNVHCAALALKAKHL